MHRIITFILFLPADIYRAYKIFKYRNNEDVLFTFKPIYFSKIYSILLPLPSFYSVLNNMYDFKVSILIYLTGSLLIIINIFLLCVPCTLTSNKLQTTSGVWKISEIDDLSFNDSIAIFSVPKSLMSLTDQVKVKIDLEDKDKLISLFEEIKNGNIK